MDLQLAGKIAIVTGGGRGIGTAIALGLAEEGAHVAIAEIDEQTAEIVASQVAEKGVKSLAVKTDVTDPASVGEMVSRVESEIGSVQILVNNAAKLPAFMTFVEEKNSGSAHNNSHIPFPQEWDFVSDNRNLDIPRNCWRG